MAKQVGPIYITGTIGGVSFYKSGNAYLVRMKGGPTRQQVKNGKNFARVRENYSEFGNCSRVGRLLRQAVKRWSNTGDGALYRRLTQRLMKVKNEDKTSVRGARCVSKALKNESGKALLKQFDFNKEAILQNVLLKPAYVNNRGVVCIDKLVPGSDIVFAEGSNRVLIKAICLELNFESGKITEHIYEELPINKEDKNSSLQLMPKDRAALMSASVSDLFYFITLEFDNAVRSKDAVLCLLDVNVALTSTTKAICKGQKLPFKIGRKLKKSEKETLVSRLCCAVIKEAPA